MSDRPNHVLAGLIFVGVCILIAVVAFLFTRPSTSSVAASDDAAVNTIVADLSPGPTATPTDSAADAPPAQVVANRGDNVPRIGTCHLDECTWFVERGSTVREEPIGRLLKVTIQSGASQHPSADFPRGFTPDLKIAWNDTTSNVYVFCSTTLPAVMLEDGGTWQTDVLDFVNGPPRVLESSAAIYARACHGADVDYPADGFAARYGYVTAPAQDEEPVISSPDDIFKLAGSAAQPG